MVDQFLFPFNLANEAANKIEVYIHFLSLGKLKGRPLLWLNDYLYFGRSQYF